MTVVDLSSGLVSECSADSLSIDPPPLGMGVPEAALDGLGLLHYGGVDGQPGIWRPHPVPLSNRVPGEAFLLRVDPVDRGANGWRILRLCVREP